MSHWQGPKLCDLCSNSITHCFHCGVCQSGNFDLCAACVDTGRWCLDDEHELFEGDAAGVTSRRSRDGTRHEFPTYTYTPLTNTNANVSYLRLITLAPGGEREDVVAGVEIHPRESVPKFVSISYHWGAPTPRHTIMLSGGRFFVGSNLYSALLHLRGKFAPDTRFWVDAISIDQQNAEEKAEQVGLMRDTYERAELTIAWMGPAENNSGMALAMCVRMLDIHGLKFFESMAGGAYQDEYNEVFASAAKGLMSEAEYKTAFLHQMAALWWDRGNNVTNKDCRDAALEAVNSAVASSSHGDGPHPSASLGTFGLQHTYASPVLESCTDGRCWPGHPHIWEIAAMHALLDRPWFARIWIVQEVVLSRNLVFQCGNDTIAGWVLYCGLYLAQRNGPKSLADRQALVNFATLWSHRRDICRAPDHTHHKHRGKSELAKLLFAFRRREASDERDKVFALHGLAVSNSGFEIDYTRPFQETYQDVAVALLRMSDDLATLCLNRSSITLPESIPTWAADWSDTSLHAAPLRGVRDLFLSGIRGADYHSELYQTTADSTRPIILDAKQGRLTLQGYVYDTVVSVSSINHVAEENLQTGLIVQNAVKRNLTALMDRANSMLQIALASRSTYEEWERFARVDDPEATYPTGEDLISVYRQILMTSHDPEGIRCSKEHFQEWRKNRDPFKNLVGSFRALDVTPLAPASVTSTAAKQELVASMRNLTLSAKDLAERRIPNGSALYRRVVKTSKGYLALAPAATNSGDRIALLAGGRAPFVVRRKDECWQLIGSVYVHGIMNGEAWDALQCSEMTFV